jgi:hypothetical protein
VDAVSEGDRVDGCGSDLAMAANLSDRPMLSFLGSVKKAIDRQKLFWRCQRSLLFRPPRRYCPMAAVGKVTRALLRLDQVDMQGKKMGMRHKYAYYWLG